MRYIILLWLVMPLLTLSAIAQHVTFQHLTPDDGLSHHLVYDILQDHEGFLWFATRDGLSRYDGQRVKTYRHTPGDPTSISDSKARVLLEDRDSVLWIGTVEGGLNRFDRRTETFTHFRHVAADSSTLSGDRIHALVQGGDGQLWIATQNAGLNRLDPATGRVRRMPYRRGDPESDDLTGPFSYDLRVDAFGNVLASRGVEPGRRGVCALDPETGHCASIIDVHGAVVRAMLPAADGVLWVVVQAGREAQLVRLERGELTDIAAWEADSPSDLLADAYGRIWIGTTDGIRIVNPEFGEGAVLRHQLGNPLSLASSWVHGLYRDDSGTVWAGTKNGASATFDAGSAFRRRWVDPDRPTVYPRNHVNAILDAGEEGLWLGTNDGLWITDREAGTLREVPLDRDGVFNPADARRIWSIARAPDGTTWIGTAGAGLYRYDPACACGVRETAFGRFRFANDRPGALADGDHSRVRDVFVASDGTLWVGTTGDVVRRDGESGAWRLFTHDENDLFSLSQEFGNVVYEDDVGRIWIGTDGGLNLVDVEYERVHRYRHDPLNPASMNANIVWTIAESSKTPGVLWIGTVGGGLNRFDPTTGRFRSFTTADGFGSNNVYGILTDDRGDLWMSTGSGISRFDPLRLNVRNFDVRDGLLTGGYNLMAYHRSEVTGEMFFGGATGYTSFHPDSIEARPAAARTVITGLYIFDTERPGMLSSGDTLRLAPDENFFRITFAALDFSRPAPARYRYRLENYDPQWRTIYGMQPGASYTGVPPGRYRFVVYGSNRDGAYSDEYAAVHVIVAPHFWDASWIRLAVVVVVMLAAAGLALHRRRIVGAGAAALDAPSQGNSLL